MMHAGRTLLEILFASVWQDALIGICVGALLLAAGKRLNAATRHVILQAALLVVVALPIGVTLSHLHTYAAIESGRGSAAASASATEHSQNTTLLRNIDFVLADRAVLWLVGIWLAGAAAFLLRITFGVAQLRRIVLRSERIADRDGVRVYASPSIPVPVALGLLRPAIVVPSELAREGGEALDCVVLHELAHVRRRDAWSHTFERIVHALFYFNPAILVLLKSLAIEREAACDDWAVAHSHDTQTYAHNLAVLALQSGISVELPAACGAVGFGHAIVNRIARLEDRHRNGSLLLSPFAFGGCTFVLLSIALSVQLLAPAIAFAPQPTIVQTASSSNCTRSALVAAPAQPPGPLPAGRVTVDVSISPSGAVTGAKIGKSSGNTTLDRAALKMAHESAYEPAMRNCKPVAGKYLFIFTSSGV
jgi:TonB family protein